MKGYTARLMSLVALFGLAVSTLPANAGGVVVTAAAPANGEINSMQVGGAYDGYATTTLSWNPSFLYQTGATIQVVASPALGGAFQECKTGTDIGGATYTTSSWSNSGGTFTLTGDANTNNITLCLLAYVSDGTKLRSAMNFSESIVTTGATVDYGAAMFYVNGGNDVLVTATVPATLSFNIADSANLAVAKNTCQLGVLSTAEVKTCDYRLKIVTNAQNGFSTTWAADHKMLTAQNATLTDVGDFTVTAGSEEYGFQLTAANTGVRNPTLGTFTDPMLPGYNEAQDLPVPTAQTEIVSSTEAVYIDGLTPAEATLVTHKASISASTNVGLYSQTVTYRTVGNF